MLKIQSFKPEYSLCNFIKSYSIIDINHKVETYKKTILPFNETCLAFIVTSNKENNSYNKCTTGIYLCPPSAKTHDMDLYKDFFYVDVSFYPGVLHEVFSIPFDKLKDRAYSIEELSINIDANILEQIHINRENKGKIVDILNAYFFKLFYNFQESSFLLNIKNLYLNCELDEFFDNSKLSIRQIQRNMNKFTGLNPRTIQRISRFNKILNNIKNCKSGNMSLVYKNYDFYDQSHLLKEFKSFSGLSCKEFMTDNTKYLQF